MAELRTVSPKLFYDSIAKEYDGLMTESYNHLRVKVKELFKNFVPNGIVVDFGGGTGLDLPWLTNYEKVYFLEPSEGMRTVAMQNSMRLEQRSKISFIENNTSAHDWSTDKLPFDEKADGILMNFAVLNCIENPTQLFEKLSLICNTSCLIVATIINPQPKSVIKNYSLKKLTALILQGRFATLAKHRELQQKAYVYSIKLLVRASEKHFEFRTYVPLNSSNLGVLILSKK